MRNFSRHSQQGAALIVALILLVALSLLAISSLNTASLDLIMTGNEQYRARALAAAEAGLAQAMKNGDFNSTDQVSTNLNNSDAFSYTISPVNGGKVESPPTGSSEGTFGAVYYNITATGTSARSAKAGVIQETYELVNTSNEITYDQSVCSTTANLDSTC